jgi:hypothetical protein
MLDYTLTHMLDLYETLKRVYLFLPNSSDVIRLRCVCKDVKVRGIQEFRFVADRLELNIQPLLKPKGIGYSVQIGQFL